MSSFDRDKDHPGKDDARRSTSIRSPLEEERNRDIAGPPGHGHRQRESDEFSGPGRPFTGPPDIGSADLNPFHRGSGHGGGMIMDPRDLNPDRRPDFTPNMPGRVPHARFDPFGPPELGPNFGSRNPPAPRGRGPPGRGGFGPGGLGFGSGPNPDHFQPPPDMFM